MTIPRIIFGEPIPQELLNPTVVGYCSRCQHPIPVGWEGDEEQECPVCDGPAGVLLEEMPRLEL